MKNFIYLITILFLIPFCLHAVEWEYIGGPNIGYINDIKKDSKGNLFIASMNGIWKSTDIGESWFQVYNHVVFAGIRTNAISNCFSIAIDSKDRIYAVNMKSIAEGNLSKIVISEDEGKTWRDITGQWRNSTSWGSDYPLNIEVDEEDNVYLCIYDYDEFLKTALLYKSSNQGKDWSNYNTKKVKEFIPGGFCIDKNHFFLFGKKRVRLNNGLNDHKGVLFLLPKADSVWKEILFPEYDNIKCVEELGEKEFLVGTDYGLFKTSDDGESWIQLDYNLFSIFDILYVSDDEIYVTSSWTMDMYLTTDKGKSFQKLTDRPIPIKHLLKYDANTFFGSEDFSEIIKSTDKCKTWLTSTNGFTGTKLKYLSVDKNDNLLAGSVKGAYKYDHTAKSWSELGLYPEVVQSIYYAPDNNIYIGATNYAVPTGKFYRSTDNGKTWNRFTEGLGDTTTVTFFDLKMTRDGTLYGGSEFGVIFRSTNKGESWEMAIPPKGCGSTAIGINSEGHVFIGNNTVYIARSKMGWNDWELVNDEYAIRK